MIIQSTLPAQGVTPCSLRRTKRLRLKRRVARNIPRFHVVARCRYFSFSLIIFIIAYLFSACKRGCTRFLCFANSYLYFFVLCRQPLLGSYCPDIFPVRFPRSLFAPPESFFTPPYQFFQLIQGFRLRVCQSVNNGIHVKLLVCAQNKRMGNAAFPVVSAQVVSAAG